MIAGISVRPALNAFISNREPILPEHVLASCAVPTIFPAVQIGEDIFWDGPFSDNPPLQELIRAGTIGAENVPDEIWLITISPRPAQDSSRAHR
jgi:NTE family protein